MSTEPTTTPLPDLAPERVAELRREYADLIPALAERVGLLREPDEDYSNQADAEALLGWLLNELAVDTAEVSTKSLVRHLARSRELRRRRDWVAAYRWASAELHDFDGTRTFMDHMAARKIDQYADQIERSELTPWADTPEPATAPAQEVPQPSELGHSPILGRALFDCDGDLWQDRGDGMWQGVGVELAMGDEELRNDHGPVREVLLVSPAAWERYERLRGLYGKFRVERVDERDQPGGDKAGAAYFVLDYVHDPYARVALGAYAQACAEGYPALAADLRAALDAAVAADLTVPTPEPDDLDKLADMIASSPATWEHISDRFPGLAHQIERVIDPELRAARKPVLEPDSDPGWDRADVAAIIEGWSLRGVSDGSQETLTALLADRDRLASDLAATGRLNGNLIEQMNATLALYDRGTDELRAARTELAEVTADRERLRGVLTQEAERHARVVLSAQRTCADDLHRALGLPDTRTDYQGHRSWADWWAELTQRHLPATLAESKRRGMVTEHQAGELERLRVEVATARRDAAALNAVRDLTRDTDGNDIHPDATVPIGEIQRVLVEEAVPGQPEPATPGGES